jgi:hypothetical protein
MNVSGDSCAGLEALTMPAAGKSRIAWPEDEFSFMTSVCDTRIALSCVACSALSDAAFQGPHLHALIVHLVGGLVAGNAKFPYVIYRRMPNSFHALIANREIASAMQS